MNYDDENWIKVYTRDTPGWLSLSWQARGLMLEIARKLPKHSGELSTGRKGLAALAGLLRAPWLEIEPFIAELVEDGRLEHDAGRQVVRDAQHVARQNAIASAAERKRRQREAEAVASSHAESRDVTRCHAGGTPSHVESPREEKRRERKEEKADPPAGDQTRAPDGPRSSRVLRPDEPLTDQRRKDHEALTANLDPREAEPEWRMFVDDRIAKSVLFASAGAVDGGWRKWVAQETVYRKKARIREQNDNGSRKRGAEITKQPSDPNAPWMKVGT